MSKGKNKKKNIQRIGDDSMNNAVINNSYKSLDMNCLRSKKSTIVSYEESLKDIRSIDWPKEVLTGEKKVTIVSPKK